jgi:hypothetical protein
MKEHIFFVHEKYGPTSFCCNGPIEKYGGAEMEKGKEFS